MAQSEHSMSTPLPEDALHDLEELDLTRYEARVLLGLLQLGAANTAQLARISGVPRTSTYQILEDLNQRGLAQRVSTKGPTTYASLGFEEVLDRLYSMQEERLKQHRERTERLRDRLAQVISDEQMPAGPYVQIIHGATQVSRMYDRLLSEAEDELLVFSRPPYSVRQAGMNPQVLETVKRRVRTRVLYEADHWHADSAAAFRKAMSRYHAAGVQARLTGPLPLKLAVVDRSTALLAMADPVQPEIGFPTTLLVEHPGYAELQADAFEMRWASAEPVVDTGAPSARAAGDEELPDLPAGEAERPA